MHQRNRPSQTSSRYIISPLNIYIQKFYNIERFTSKLGVVPFVCTFRKCNRRNKNVFENIKINYSDMFRNYCPWERCIPKRTMNPEEHTLQLTIPRVYCQVTLYFFRTREWIKSSLTLKQISILYIYNAISMYFLSHFRWRRIWICQTQYHFISN